MGLTQAKARRAIRWSEVEFEGVRDPRRGRARHDHGGLLALLTAALATGVQTLRGVEGFGDELSVQARRALGLKDSPSDTSLYRLLATQSLFGFALTAVKQVKQALLTKRIGNDLFPFGVVAVDGKSAWSGHYEAHRKCRRQEGTTGSGDYHLLMQRACLVSSSARPCVTQTVVDPDAGEADTFKQTFAFLLRHFGRSFDFITHDAGGTSRENAALVHGAQKAYVLAIKGNQPRVHTAARSRLGTRETPADAAEHGEAQTEERADGALIRREVFRCAVESDDPEIEFAGARQLWRVRQTSTCQLPSGQPETTIEDRYFITNRVLSAAHALTIVRLHWGIENGPNWTMDMELGEDDGTPCATGNGILIVSWLRLIAYNVLSIWRHHLKPVRDEVLACWERARRWLRDAFRAFDRSNATLA